MSMVDVRRDERVRALLRARIVYNNHNSSIDCTVKNISSTGAKIALSSSLAVPDEFDLDVPQKNRTYRARLVWRRDESIGVRFVERSATETAELKAQIARLEDEKRQLTMTVATLRKRLERLGQATECDE